MKIVKRRRVEIIAFERERVVVREPGRRGGPWRCPLCDRESQWLTTRQAAALAQVTAPTVRRWLARGQAHGVKTAGGRHRVCRQSLFVLARQCAADCQSAVLERVKP